MQRQFGLALAFVGMLGLLLTPLLLPIAFSMDLGTAGSASDPITQEDAKEIREQLNDGNYESGLSDYASLVTPDYLAAIASQAAVFGMPLVSLLLFITGGYIVTRADAKGHSLGLDDYPDNPSVRDELRMDSENGDSE